MKNYPKRCWIVLILDLIFVQEVTHYLDGIINIPSVFFTFLLVTFTLFLKILWVQTFLLKVQFPRIYTFKISLIVTGISFFICHSSWRNIFLELNFIFCSWLSLSQSLNPLNARNIKWKWLQCTPRLPASPSLFTFQFEALLVFSFRHEGVFEWSLYFQPLFFQVWFERVCDPILTKRYNRHRIKNQCSFKFNRYCFGWL